MKTLGNLKAEEKVYKYGLWMSNSMGDYETKSVKGGSYLILLIDHT